MVPRSQLNPLIMRAMCIVALAFGTAYGEGRSQESLNDFQTEIAPLLETYCYSCHGYGADEGQITLDHITDEKSLFDNSLWLKVLQNVRSGVMPPPGEDRLSEEEVKKLTDWIQFKAFRIDPANPDPGHVTLRRLNRNEYQNTIKDLMGYDFQVDQAFPPDNTGHGFDNIGDLLTTSPALVEKYIEAATEIVEASVPSATLAPMVQNFDPSAFLTRTGQGPNPDGRISCSQIAVQAMPFEVTEQGEHRVNLEFWLYGTLFPADGTATIRVTCDDEQVFEKVFGWQDEHTGTPVIVEFTRTWEPSSKELLIQIEPVKEEDKPAVRVPLTMKLIGASVIGPLEESKWKNPPHYFRFFTRAVTPEDPGEKRDYAREVLWAFASKAFRRPVDEPTLERLVMLAEHSYSLPEVTFEQGVQQSMIAVLSSRRFLFRTEEIAADERHLPFARIDEYSLASRLSYLIWNSLPDEELFDLASRNELRQNLKSQVDRMLTDAKSERFMTNFVSQWLRTQEVDVVEVDQRLIMARDLGLEAEEVVYREALNKELLRRQNLSPEELAKDGGKDLATILQELAPELPGLNFLPGIGMDEKLRKAMRLETELHFQHIVKENRSVLELIDCDYTFLNEQLAKHYGIEGVQGPEMRKVTLPDSAQRGGILTHAGILMLTSQSTRTSAVKRGIFVLENLLGTPPPPAPPDLPTLEDVEKSFSGRSPTLRETLEIHRQNPVCASCHARMDPIGLSMENYNALGLWRTTERKQDILVEGELVTGEKLTTAADLRKVLASDRKTDFFRCLTEKLTIYAIGRGLEYYDTYSVDQIVDRLEGDQGEFATLLMGVVDSVPFQKSRNLSVDVSHKAAATLHDALASQTEQEMK